MGTNLMRAMLLTSASAAMVATAAPTAAYAQEATYQIDIPAQSMGDALRALGKATKQNIVFSGSVVKGKRSAAVRGRMSAGEALERILSGSGLKMSRGSGGGLVVMEGNDRAATSGGQDHSGTAVASGQVVDENTGANLKGALVELRETGQTTSTDDLGNFRFPRLRPGTYNVRISYLGYQDTLTTIQVGGGASGQRFAMVGGTQGNEIVVYGRLSSRAQSLNQQRTAPNNSEVVSDDQLGNFTGTTVSEALRKVPGITFQQSGITGDGTNIIIRGLEPDLNTVTLNGLRLPDTSGQGRSANLSNVLADSISKITVNKSLLPSQDSSGTGGLVEIETKSPLDRPRRYLNLAVEMGKKGRDFNDDFLASATASARFGRSDQFGLSASVQIRERSVESINQSQEYQYGQYLPLEADTSAFFADPTAFIDPRRLFPFKDGGEKIFPVSQTINSFVSDTSNKTFGVTAEWQIDDSSNLRVDFTRIDAKVSSLSRSAGDFYYSLYMPVSVQELGGEIRQSLNYFNATNLSRGIDTQDTRQVTNALSFRGETETGRLNLSYGGGYSKGSSDFARRSISTGGFIFHDPALVSPDALDETEGRVLSVFAPVTGGIQQPLFIEDGFDFFNDPAQHALQNAGTGTVKSYNKRITAEMSGRYSFADSALRYFEAGVFYERADFDTENRPGMASFDQFVGSGASAADLGLKIDNSIWGRIGAAPGVGILLPEDLDEVFSRLRALEGDGVTVRSFNVDPRLAGELTREREFSGYVQVHLDIGDLEIIGGVRATQVKTTAKKLRILTLRNADGTSDPAFEAANTEIVEFDGTVLDILPRVLANYRITDNIVFRGGYFLSVARPKISSLSRSPIIGLSLFPSGGPQSNQPTLNIQQGNPALEPAFTHNFDISAELYTSNVGNIKIGGFYKIIHNYIESNSFNSRTALDGIDLPNDPRFQDLPSNIFINVSRPENAVGVARIWGAEVAAEHRFASLPGLLSGLGVYANYTYSDSSRDSTQRWSSSPVFDSDGQIIGRDDLSYTRTSPFFQQSKHSVTAALTYERKNLDAVVSYSFQDRRLINFGDSVVVRDRFGFDRYADQLESLDIRVEYRMAIGGNRYRVWFEGQDLLDGSTDPLSSESLGGANGVPRITSARNFLGGRSVRVGLSATF